MIYLDNAATTRVSEAAAEAAIACMREEFGNPSSLHGLGIRGEERMTAARQAVANMLGASPDEVVFTSGGTEANNLAILGAAEARRRRGKHVITTAVEHASVLEPVKYLESCGYEVTYLAPDRDCRVTPGQVAAAVRPDTVLVSVMRVNNEVGAAQPVAEICRAVRAVNPETLIHTDGVQAFGKLDGSLAGCGVDLASVSGHKINAPKGVGALYVKKGVRLQARAFGGGQERALRPGTEPLPAIAALGAACAEWQAQGDSWRESMERILARLRARLGGIAGVEILPGSGAPHILGIAVEGYPSEVTMRMLEQREIYVSSGSACSRGRRSHVLRAMGVPGKTIAGALRVSIGRDTTEEEADALADALENINQRGSKT